MQEISQRRKAARVLEPWGPLCARLLWCPLHSQPCLLGIDLPSACCPWLAPPAPLPRPAETSHAAEIASSVPPAPRVALEPGASALDFPLGWTLAPAATLGDPGQGLPFGHGQMPYVFQGHAILIGAASGGENDVITYISCMTIILSLCRARGWMRLYAVADGCDLARGGSPVSKPTVPSGLGGRRSRRGTAAISQGSSQRSRRQG